MEITHKNPGSYKTERKSAFAINVLYFLTCIIGSIVIVTFVPDVGAKNNDYCDKMFSELFFIEIPIPVKIECQNRFQYNINKISRAHPLNSNNF